MTDAESADKIIREAMDELRQLMRQMREAGLRQHSLYRQARDMLAAADAGDTLDFMDGGASTLMNDMERKLAKARRAADNAG